MSEKAATVFIGSSSEGIEYARAIENNFFHDEDVELFPWYRFFRKPMLTTMEHLEQLKTFDFAVFVLTPDDIISSRDVTQVAPRDNLIYEMGVAVAAMGRDRVFPITPLDPQVRLPSDFLGVNPFQYKAIVENGDVGAHEGAVAVACNQIRSAVRNLGAIDTKAGQPNTGLRSGIRFHPSVALTPSGKRLRFKIAYRGPGTLIDVKLDAFFMHIHPANDGGQYTRTWHPIETRTNLQPEIMVGWSTSHVLSLESELSKYINLPESGPVSVEAFAEMPGRLVFFVRGFDSSSLIQQFGKKEYKGTDIRQGRHGSFIDINSRGEIEHVYWDRFDSFINVEYNADGLDDADNA